MLLVPKFTLGFCMWLVSPLPPTPFLCLLLAVDSTPGHPLVLHSDVASLIPWGSEIPPQMFPYALLLIVQLLQLFLPGLALGLAQIRNLMNTC